MTTHGRILVVDDEPQIRRALSLALAAHDYEVRVAEHGDQALIDLGTWTPDVMILDLVMPGRDGLDVLREVRTWTDLPVIVLSARGKESDKVTALDLGADDYLTKPFGVEELLARIRAILRRRSAAPEAIVGIGALTIDLARRTIARGGAEIHLTPTEFDLLRVLVTNADRIVTHRQLLEQVWGAYAADNAQQLRVYINYLRKKIEADPAHPEIIVTEPGIGYRLHL
jgi:two-component system, OmpR family, KDP operon response regulator KdpE